MDYYGLLRDYYEGIPKKVQEGAKSASRELPGSSRGARDCPKEPNGGLGEARESPRESKRERRESPRDPLGSPKKAQKGATYYEREAELLRTITDYYGLLRIIARLLRIPKKVQEAAKNASMRDYCVIITGLIRIIDNPVIVP